MILAKLSKYGTEQQTECLRSIPLWGWLTSITVAADRSLWPVATPQKGKKIGRTECVWMTERRGVELLVLMDDFPAVVDKL